MMRQLLAIFTFALLICWTPAAPAAAPRTADKLNSAAGQPSLAVSDADTAWFVALDINLPSEEVKIPPIPVSETALSLCCTSLDYDFGSRFAETVNSRIGRALACAKLLDTLGGSSNAGVCGLVVGFLQEVVNYLLGDPFFSGKPQFLK
jgi:hypothetical protein